MRTCSPARLSIRAPFGNLFPGMLTEDMPFIAPVEREGVYHLSPRGALRIPAPPPMWNHGNHVASVDEIGRWLAERAEELGVTIVPETSATSLLVQGGRVVGIRTGDKGRGRDGEELPNFEPGSDLKARVTILAEGTQGHLTGIALDRFGLASKPQVWALGVKEVWDVEKPLDRVIHTMGWPLRGAKRYREFGGSFIYPMGENRVTLGMVVGLDATDATLSVHDLLQELKTHPKVGRILAGGERVAWGAKTIPEGGFLALPDRLHFPGGMIVGDGAGLVNVPALKGIHYAMTSGMLAAETAVDAVGPGQTSWAPGALEGYDRALRESYVWSDLKRVRNVRPAFKHGFLGGSLRAGAAILTLGMLPGNKKLESDADVPVEVGNRRGALSGAGREARVRQALERLPEREQDARRRAEPHPRAARRCRSRWRRPGCTCAPRRCTRSASPTATAGWSVEVTASNCVQCGAITAKGGRLTPPEGGSGPEYSVM